MFVLSKPIIDQITAWHVKKVTLAIYFFVTNLALTYLNQVEIE